MKKLILILVLPVFLFFLIVITGALLIAPGSYANSETYVMNIPYNKCDSAFIILRQTYPELQDYILSENGDSIPVKDSDGFFDFYLPDINYSVSCRIYSLNDPNMTQILLVFALDIKNKQGYKRINGKEISKEENKIIKKAFEKDVLDKLGKWEHGANAFLRFLGFH